MAKTRKPSLRSRRKKLGQPCPSCFGKGYRTELTSYNSRYVRYPKIKVKVCGCARGDQLKEHFTIKQQYR